MTSGVDFVECLKAHDWPAASATASSETVSITLTTADLPFSVTTWEAKSPARCTLSMSAGTAENCATYVKVSLKLIRSYHEWTEFLPGTATLNVGDGGVVPGLAFSAATPDFGLLPDPLFYSSKGYAATRGAFRDWPTPWEERLPIAFWRGGSTGNRTAPSWRTLPRVRLCEIAARHPDLFDAGLTDTWHIHGEERTECEQSGLMREIVHISKFPKWRYQIDIDGHTNSWPGLFQKLLTGSPVLKVDSAQGFRQWYYDRLVPWQNYVPVSATMQDLVPKLRWLMAHDDAARAIGERGRQLALSMTCESELPGALATIRSVMS